MQSGGSKSEAHQQPRLLAKAQELGKYVASLSPATIATSMRLSGAMADKTYSLMQSWASAEQRPAIDAFLGDIYSGLQVHTLSGGDRAYANDHLHILSGLYGVLRALDSVASYRLEMGYRLPDEPYKNLYTYWGDSIAKQLPPDELIINVSAVEYTKAVLPYVSGRTVVTPKFMTVSPKTGEPTFVVVHAKIARGAYARWLIQERIQDAKDLSNFTDLGYVYAAALSTPTEPVFICKTFQGLGLSVRLRS